MSSQYRLTPEFFRNFNLKVLGVTGPVLLLAVAIGLYGAGGGQESSGIIPAIVVVGVILPVTVGLNLRRQKKSYRTFCIELDEDRIARIQDGYSRLEIRFSEIATIREVVKKGLVIQGGNARQVLFLPSTLERFEELRARLASIHLIEPQPPQSAFGRLGGSLLPSVAVLVCMAVVYRAESVLLVLAGGTVVIGSLIAGWILIARSPHIEQRVKRGLWFIAFPILSVAAKMWFTAFGA